MGKLIYSMITSLDGYVEATQGGIGRGAEDPEVHTFIGRRFSNVGTYLYGRRMYETMVFWETVHQQPDVPPHILEYGEIWRAANKVVYSRTLQDVSSERTRLEREFDPEAVGRLKAETDHDITVNGPMLAAQAIAAGLVDEYHLFLTTSAVGGGKRFFPDGVRLDLELVEIRVFPSGLLYAHYRVP
jgi:dihydrofolate reductase